MNQLWGRVARSPLVVKLLIGPAAMAAGYFLFTGFANAPSPRIRFELHTLPFVLENDETAARNAPETMAGGVAIFDYNRDGRPDIFLTNGANIATLKKDSSTYSNRLFRNDGGGKFTDVTEQAGLRGAGYDTGVAVADYDNDGFPDLFVAGVHRNTLYHNNGDGTFTDVTVKAGLDRSNDSQYGPLWSVGAAWVDVNNDGLLDLFVVNYLQWKYSDKPVCTANGVADYCHPSNYKGTPDQLFLNRGNGRFEDVSVGWGLRDKVGKGMGAAVADYDGDGRPDIFVTNDAEYNFLFHNTGAKLEEAAFNSGVALPEDGQFVSGMGVDFRDVDNDGWPDIFFVALNKQTFPLFRNTGKGEFQETTAPSGLRSLSMKMAGFGAGIYDFDNDGWKDLFVARGHVTLSEPTGVPVEQSNTVFRNGGVSGTWTALTEQAGFDASPPARHRGSAFGDLDGDGRVDVVVSALGRKPEIWINRTEKSGHWLDVALEGTKSNRDGIGARVMIQTKSGKQFNHMTAAVSYASASAGPVHFGLGTDAVAESIEIRWPSGIVQRLREVKADCVLRVREEP